MSWFFESRLIQSDKNKLITLRRTLGRWEVYVDGTDQSTGYMSRMWRRLFKPYAKERFKRILILGLGGGDVLPILYGQFPACSITVLEWDEEMIAIARSVLHPDILRRTRIIQGDAKNVKSLVEGVFDLILVDLFVGKDVSPAICSSDFFMSLGGLLERDGFLFFNVFRQKELKSLVSPFFSQAKCLTYNYNTVFVFRHFGRGKAGDALPEGYQSYRTSEAYLRREVQYSKRTHVITQDGCIGMRTSAGPFVIDKFFGDGEPTVGTTGFRMTVWRPITRIDRPEGWMQSRLFGGVGLTGFAEVHDGEYWKEWSGHAIRHRKKWMSQKELVIRECTQEQFIEAYKKIRKDPTLKALFVNLLKKKIRSHGERVRIVGVSRKEEGSPLLAGFASLDIPEIKQSLHLISFIHPPARKTSAGVGLMDDWFIYGRQKGLQYLDFGLFWSKGEPRTWKPFSRFKAQFGIRYLMHPDPLMKVRVGD